MLESEAFDLIIHEHCKLTHSGRDKTWEAVDALFYGITRYEVSWVTKHCRNCLLNRASATVAPLEPIRTDNPFERIQIDLIDMRHEPSDRYS